MAKWFFYVLVFIYLCYRAVYGATSILVDGIHYDEDGYLLAGTRKTVTCRGTNKNQKLEWVDPFDKVVKQIPANRVYAQEQSINGPRGIRTPGLVLTFSELLASDTGVYQCRSGNQKKSVSVCVLQPSEFIESEDNPPEVTIEAGRSITLACQAKGDPEPRILWKRKIKEEEDEYIYLNEGDERSKYKVNRRYKIEGYESLLTISDVEPGDAGVYYCVAKQESPMLDNCTWEDVTNVTLQVNYKPVFQNDEETEELVYGANNEIVNIKCEADGWPKPTYRWFKDLGGDALYEFDKSKIVIDEDSAILAVTAGPTTYEKIYKCTANNIFGDTDKSFKLMRREKPLRANDVESVATTNSSVYLKVSWDEMIFFPVDSFSVQYIPSSLVRGDTPGKSDWLRAKQIEIENIPIDLSTILEDDDKESEESEESENESSSMLVILDDLEPETEYFVRVSAVNEAGEAPWSETISVTTLDEDESNPEQETTTEKPTSDAEVNDDQTGMFYGIFFTGAILIVVVVCMFVMRLV